MHMKYFLNLGRVCNVMNVNKHLAFTHFIRRKLLKLIQWFVTLREKKDNRVLMSRDYRSVVVLKTSIFAVDASLSVKYLFQEHHISAVQLAADSCTA